MFQNLYMRRQNNMVTDVTRLNQGIEMKNKVEITVKHCNVKTLVRKTVRTFYSVRSSE